MINAAADVPVEFCLIVWYALGLLFVPHAWLPACRLHHGPTRKPTCLAASISTCMPWHCTCCPVLQEYKEVFEPLLLEEAGAQVLRGIEEGCVIEPHPAVVATCSKVSGRGMSTAVACCCCFAAVWMRQGPAREPRHRSAG